MLVCVVWNVRRTSAEWVAKNDPSPRALALAPKYIHSSKCFLKVKCPILATDAMAVSGALLSVLFVVLQPASTSDYWNSLLPVAPHYQEGTCQSWCLSPRNRDGTLYSILEKCTLLACAKCPACKVQQQLGAKVNDVAAIQRPIFNIGSQMEEEVRKLSAHVQAAKVSPDKVVAAATGSAARAVPNAGELAFTSTGPAGPAGPAGPVTQQPALPKAAPINPAVADDLARPVASAVAAQLATLATDYQLTGAPLTEGPKQQQQQQQQQSHDATSTQTRSSSATTLSGRLPSWSDVIYMTRSDLVGATD